MNINATLFLQAIVFAILVWFTMRYVWPPLSRALDERAAKIAQGLAAAEQSKQQLSAAQQEGQSLVERARQEAAERMAAVLRQSQAMVDEAKARAAEQAQNIIAAAHEQAQQQMAKAREVLRQEVAVLAVKGAEQILRREINPVVHAQLLTQLQTEL